MFDPKPAHHHSRRDFRWRSSEVTRIEGLSDAVFAIAVALLIVSVEVPKTFDELAAADSVGNATRPGVLYPALLTVDDKRSTLIGFEPRAPEFGRSSTSSASEFEFH